MQPDQLHARFGTTNWTLIDALRDHAHATHDRAITTLTTRYWPAVYASCRRMGRSPDEAAELTQAFFVHVAFGRKLFERADPKRGRLRTLILTALQRYARDIHDHEIAQGSERRVSLDDLEREEGFLARQPEASAEEMFEHRWATAVLEQAVERCGQYFESIDKAAHWEAFHRAVLQPAVRGCEAPPLSAVATELGFSSAIHVASAMKVVRKRMKILLREAAAETAEDPDDQDAEYRHVVATLG